MLPCMICWKTINSTYQLEWQLQSMINIFYCCYFTIRKYWSSIVNRERTIFWAHSCCQDHWLKICMYLHTRNLSPSAITLFLSWSKWTVFGFHGFHQKRPQAAIYDGKIGYTPFTTVDTLDAPGCSGRFLGTPSYVHQVSITIVLLYRTWPN